MIGVDSSTTPLELTYHLSYIAISAPIFFGHHVPKLHTHTRHLYNILYTLPRVGYFLMLLRLYTLVSSEPLLNLTALSFRRLAASPSSFLHSGVYFSSM